MDKFIFDLQLFDKPAGDIEDVSGVDTGINDWTKEYANRQGTGSVTYSYTDATSGKKVENTVTGLQVAAKAINSMSNTKVTITLNGDCVLNGSVWFEYYDGNFGKNTSANGTNGGTGNTITLNLNGHTITNTTTTDDWKPSSSLICVANNNTLNIVGNNSTNSKIFWTDGVSGFNGENLFDGIFVWTDGSLSVESATVEGITGGVRDAQAGAKSITIKEGAVISSKMTENTGGFGIKFLNSGGTLKIEDGATVKGFSQALVLGIQDHTVTKVEIDAGNFVCDSSGSPVTLGDGSSVEISGGTFNKSPGKDNIKADYGILTVTANSKYQVVKAGDWTNTGVESEKNVWVLASTAADDSKVTKVATLTDANSTTDKEAGETTYSIASATLSQGVTTLTATEGSTIDRSKIALTYESDSQSKNTYAQFKIGEGTAIYTPLDVSAAAGTKLIPTAADATEARTLDLEAGDAAFRVLTSTKDADGNVTGYTAVDYTITAAIATEKKAQVSITGNVVTLVNDAAKTTVDSIVISKVGDTTLSSNNTLAKGDSLAVLDGILYTGTITSVTDATNAVGVTGTAVTATQITTDKLKAKTFTLGESTALTVDSITYSGANGTVKVNSDAVTIGGTATVTATGTATELAKKTFTLGDTTGTITIGESGATYKAGTANATVLDKGTTATVTGDIVVTTGDISAKTFTLGTSSTAATIKNGDSATVTYSSKGGTVKIGEEGATDITGTVTAKFTDATSSITVGGVKYTSGANPSYVELTSANNKITAALDAKSGTITVTPASTGSVTVSDVTYTGDGTGTIKFVNGDVTEFAAGTVTASIAAGKKLVYGDITYTENSGSATADVIFTKSGENVVPSLGTGAVKVTGNTSGLTINDVKYTADTSGAIIFTTKDSVTSASITSGTETATFAQDASAIIGNIKYTATTANSVDFTKNNTNSASLVSAVAEAKGLQLATANATTNNNTYTYANATINAAVGTATLTGAGSGAAVTISGSAVDTVNVKGVTSAYKLNEKALNISGDTDYTVMAAANGTEIGAISGITAGVTVTEAANVTLQTDKAGKFTFGSTAYNITGDNEVTFVTDENSKVANVADFTGVLNAATGEVTVNGVGFTTSNTDTSVVGAADGIAGVYGLVSGDTIGGSLDGVSISMAGSASSSTLPSVLTIGDNVVSLTADTNGVVIKDNEITGLAANASLQVANAGTYVVNGTTLTVAAGDVVRGTSEETAEIFDPSNVAEVNESVAAAVESLASAIINTEDYEDLSKDTTKLAEVTEAINATSATADKSALNGDMKFAVSVPSGSNSQDVDLSANTGKKDVTLTTGNQSLKFNNEGGNVAEIGKDATGEKTVELGNGGDVVAIAKGADKKATINITAGTGPDTVVSGANASVDVGKGGATKVRAVGGATVTMNNYNAADSKAGVQTTNSNIAAAIGNGNITLENGVIGTSEGKVALNSGSASADVVTSADSGDTEGSTIANLYNNAGKMTKVGFTHSDGGTVDLSVQKAGTVIQGNSTGSKKNESTLLGGSGNDVIYAGSGDVIDAGAGANKITLSSSANAEVGATVQMTSATGRNNIDGFNYGFGDNNDAISLDMTNAKFSIDDSNNLIVKNGRAKSTLLGASADGDTSYAQVLIKDTASGETTKAAVAKEGNVISVSSDEDNFANNYIGDGSGLSFSSYESEVNLNLSDTTATFGGEEVQVSGINNVTLGEADATVFGSSAKETITAGNGNETIWAGAGKDTLNGFSGKADDKSGSITFGFMAGDGKDVINNFGYLTTENAQTADRVWTTGQFEAALSGNDVVLSFSGNKKDSLHLTGMAGKNIQLSENGNLESVTTVLQVNDTLLTYDGLATKYVATGSNAAVVASSLASSANIWLEDKYVNLSNNTTYTGKITAINAAAVEGQATLVGNSYNNVITGAQGSSSMWGGDSTSNDTMIGGTEGNMFFYGVTDGNEGNDSISGITEDDTVNLFGIQLSDIDLANTTITNSAISLKFNAGGSLTMGNNGQTFMLANDSNQRYTYDKENSQWTKA